MGPWCSESPLVASVVEPVGTAAVVEGETPAPSAAEASAAAAAGVGVLLAGSTWAVVVAVVLAEVAASSSMAGVVVVGFVDSVVVAAVVDPLIVVVPLMVEQRLGVAVASSLWMGLIDGMMKP